MLRKLEEYQPCIPTRGASVPVGPDWIHEIKHHGYLLIVQREGKRVRLFNRNGYDWTDRYPLIVEAALGISDFNGLHSRRHDDGVQLYAFDILALDGGDLRKLPLHLRKNNLARLLKEPHELLRHRRRGRAARRRDNPLQAELAGLPEQVRADVALFEVADEDAFGPPGQSKRRESR